MNTYLLFKSLHLIAVISWMAGLLYLPRIFVYHSQNSTQQIISEVFKIMERKLFFYIMTPAMPRREHNSCTRVERTPAATWFRLRAAERSGRTG